MNVRFYNISDPPNKINKNAPKTGGFLVDNVRFTEAGALDVRHVEILVQFYETVSGEEVPFTDIIKYHEFNYFYVPKNQRYYYITEISTEGALVRIKGISDPLKSFADDILGSTQYVSRSQSKANHKIVDNLLPIHSEHLFLIDPFGAEVYDQSCIYAILETAGKGPSS